MSLHLPPPSFRDSYRWMAQPAEPSVTLPFGRSGRIHPIRAPYEFYPTPPEATRALLSVETFDGTIWEPACGRGAISTVLETAGYQVVSTDLVQRDYGTGGTVAMLLNLASLCHPSRHSLWIENPPSAIYGLDELVCWPEGDPARARPSTNQQRYCWVVWKPSHGGRPTFWWLSMRNFAHESAATRLAMG
jgi:hypothetical protein